MGRERASLDLAQVLTRRSGRFGARPGLTYVNNLQGEAEFMEKRKIDAPITLGDDILDRLRDLHKQVTVERSHYYTGRCISDAINEITRFRKLLEVLTLLTRRSPTPSGSWQRKKTPPACSVHVACTDEASEAESTDVG